MDNLDRYLAPLRGYVEELERMAGIVDAPPPAEIPPPTQAFDTLRAQVGQHFADWTPPEPDPLYGTRVDTPLTPYVQPPATDPLAAIIPPLSEWPADAVACMWDDSGYLRWLVTTDYGDWEAWGRDTAPDNLPPGFDWRRSLRLRPQTGA